MEGHCRKGHESLEDQRRVGHHRGEMGRSLKDCPTQHRKTTAIQV